MISLGQKLSEQSTLSGIATGAVIILLLTLVLLQVDLNKLADQTEGAARLIAALAVAGVGAVGLGASIAKAVKPDVPPVDSVASGEGGATIPPKV